MLQQIISLVSGSKPANDAKETKNISFCEDCGEVCDANCRSEAILEQAKDKFSAFNSGVTVRL